jgi:hypothetical protein
MIILPQNIYFLSELFNKISRINDNYIVNQLLKILFYIYVCLLELSRTPYINEYISHINITQDEDDTVLFEWNYEFFRIGFYLVKNQEEINCFFIVKNPITNLYTTDTRKIKGNLLSIIKIFVKYVFENA